MIKICFTVASLNTYNKLRNIKKSPCIRDFSSKDLFDCCLIDEVNMVYSMYDRMIVGGAKPVKEKLKLEA